jgi:DNA topoisomerase-6 subunit B
VKHEGQRRAIFLRYLGEVAGAVSRINQADRERLYQRLLEVARRRTVEADVKLDDRGRPVEGDDADFGKGVLIVAPQEAPVPRDADAKE